MHNTDIQILIIFCSSKVFVKKKDIWVLAELIVKTFRFFFINSIQLKRKGQDQNEIKTRNSCGSRGGLPR